MPRRLYLTGPHGSIELELTADGVVFAGEAASEVRPTSRDHCTVLDASGVSFDAATSRSGTRVWVSIDGDVFEFTVGDSAPAGAEAVDSAALAPPMAGRVTRVAVAEGQRVRQGDILVAIEAMKMEIAIRAPRDAVVKRIGCREGDLVQPGTPIVDLADAPEGAPDR